MNLQVILKEKAVSVNGRYQLSNSGKSLTADKVYVCVGGKPNTDFLKADSTRSILTDKGYVKVCSHAQAEHLIPSTLKIVLSYMHVSVLMQSLQLNSLLSIKRLPNSVIAWVEAPVRTKALFCSIASSP